MWHRVNAPIFAGDLATVMERAAPGGLVGSVHYRQCFGVPMFHPRRPWRGGGRERPREAERGCVRERRGFGDAARLRPKQHVHALPQWRATCQPLAAWAHAGVGLAGLRQQPHGRPKMGKSADVGSILSGLAPVAGRAAGTVPYRHTPRTRRAQTSSAGGRSVAYRPAAALQSKAPPHKDEEQKPQ